MKHFNSPEGLIQAYAQKKHQNNLWYGGVFTDNQEQALADGFSTWYDEDEQATRISKLTDEVEQARKRIKLVSHPYELKGIGIYSPSWVIKDFGHALA